MVEFILNKQKILVVDDQDEMRKAVLRILKIAGFQTAEAQDGIKALNILANEKIDLVISDLRMPEMDGVELLHEVRRQYSCPFILMTGFSEVINAAEAYEMGVDGFLQKPFQQKELLACIKEAFESREKLSAKPQTIEGAKPLKDQFCGIPIHEFLRGNEIEFPIFLKLSDRKFVKIATSSEDFTEEKISSLKLKGIEFLYLLREDFKSYISFASKISEAILASKKVDAEKKANFLKHSSEVILQFGFQQYMDKDVFELARLNVEQSLSLLTDSKNLLDLLNALTTHSTELYAHSMGVSLISCLTAKALDWESSPLFFRVVAGSVLHDLGKRDFPNELLAKSLEEMSASELEIWQSHPKLGAELVSQIENMPSEVIQIVLHHHELCDGSGYPDGITSPRIHPVAKVIAASDEFIKLYKGAPGYGKGMIPNEALKIMKKKNKGSNPFPKWENLAALSKVFDQ